MQILGHISNDICQVSTEKMLLVTQLTLALRCLAKAQLLLSLLKLQ